MESIGFIFKAVFMKLICVVACEDSSFMSLTTQCFCCVTGPQLICSVAYLGYFYFWAACLLVCYVQISVGCILEVGLVDGRECVCSAYLVAPARHFSRNVGSFSFLIEVQLTLKCCFFIFPVAVFESSICSISLPALEIVFFVFQSSW